MLTKVQCTSSYAHNTRWQAGNSICPNLVLWACFKKEQEDWVKKHGL